MLIDDLKSQMFAAMKAKQTVEKEVLRTAIGDVTKSGGEAGDEEVIAVLRKMMKGLQESRKLSASNAEASAQLDQEMEIVKRFLPQALSVEQIVESLAPVAAGIRSAGNAGQATGVAMKHLKSISAEVNGKDVAAAVAQLRD